MTHRIERGQEYLSSQPSHLASATTEYTRIRVVRDPVGDTADVVTVTEKGREVRPRRIQTSQLHESRTRKGGRDRTTGYYLVKPAAGGDQ